VFKPLYSERQGGLNKVKASAFRRRPVTRAYSPEQTTRLTGGADFKIKRLSIKLILNK